TEKICSAVSKFRTVGKKRRSVFQAPHRAFHAPKIFIIRWQPGCPASLASSQFGQHRLRSAPKAPLYIVASEPRSSARGTPTGKFSRQKGWILLRSARSEVVSRHRLRLLR